MTCKCKSIQEHSDREREQWSYSQQQQQEYYKNEAERLKKTIATLQQNSNYTNYTIEEYERVGPHVVIKVKYLDSKCDYEGQKILVYLNVPEKSLIMWRKIDPHFKDGKIKLALNEAPSPVARFPANKAGWDDAIEYLKRKDYKYESSNRKEEYTNFPNTACMNH